MTYEALKKWLRATNGIDVALGLWLFVSPWALGYSSHAVWNSWIVGGSIAVFAAIQLSKPTRFRALSVLNMLLGAWAFASPWIFRFTDETRRFVSTLCVGAIVFLLSTYSTRGVGRMRPSAHA